MVKLLVVGAALLCALPIDAFTSPSRLPRSVVLKVATSASTTDDKPQEESSTKQLKLDTPAARQKYVNFAKPRLLELLADLSSDTVVERAHLLM
jgi:hypothetical protein